MLSEIPWLTAFKRPLRASHNANIIMASKVIDLAEDEFQPSSSSPISLDPQGRPQATSHEHANRRRKVPESVTLNACTNCKKARAKVATHPLGRIYPTLSSQGTDSCSASAMERGRLARGVSSAVSQMGVTTRSMSRRRRRTWFARYTACRRRTSRLTNKMIL